ncbi:Alpha-mannosidase 2 [Smittium mucronatum]|uniref:Alpha-mannosidase 2 n=1 Tax=Smittium mucronatum TaxID=133383 RepID=A0A1R0H906_9FUNG|nr:Alpha-mannosidase 2 [Smittium mucronatum]
MYIPVKPVASLCFLYILYLIFPPLLGIPPWAPQFGGPDLPFSSETKNIWKPPKKLVLHILPHTHNDLGWNLTFEEYYFQYVRFAMRNVIIELHKSPHRRFTWAESPYIEFWLKNEGHLPNNILPSPELSKKTWLQLLRESINSGQFEFTGLEYSSPDEFLSTLYSQFTNMDVGRRYLASNFNVSSRVGYHIDNFGHRQTTPLLLKANGIDKLILGRMSFKKENFLKENGGFHFNWLSDFNSSFIFTHYLSIHYGFPARSFDFDRQLSCNTKHMLKLLNHFANSQVQLYPSHGQILVMMGDDFRFVEAKRAFDCLDSIISLSQSGKLPAFGSGSSQISLRYSTPSEYMRSVSDYFSENPLQKNLIPNIQGDFGQYNDIPLENYWTGIYSSRPFLKFYIRKAERLLRQSESSLALFKLFSFPEIPHDVNSSQKISNVPVDRIEKLDHELESSRKQLSFTLHHDAVTGTCTPGTYLDYINRLNHSIMLSSSVLLNSTREMISAINKNRTPIFLNQVFEADSFEEEIEGESGQSNGSFSIPYTLCNPSKCSKISLIVLNYADLSSASKLITLGLHSKDIEVIDSLSNKPVPLQIELNSDNLSFSELFSDSSQNAHENSFSEFPYSTPHYKIHFIAQDIPPMGKKNYILKASNNKKHENSLTQSIDISKEPAVLKFSNSTVFNPLKVSLNKLNPGQIILEINNQKIIYEQRYYLASKFRGSGAYLFHSNIQMYIMIFFYIYTGLILGMIVQAYSENRPAISSLFGYRSQQNKIFLKPSTSASIFSRKHLAYSKYSKDQYGSINVVLRHILFISLTLLFGSLAGISISLIVLQIIPDRYISEWSNSQSLYLLIAPTLALGFLARKISDHFTFPFLSYNRNFQNISKFVSKEHTPVYGTNRFLTRFMYGMFFGIFFGLFFYPEFHSRTTIPNGFSTKLNTGNLQTSLTIFYKDSKTTILMSAIPNDKHNNPIIKVVTTLSGGKNKEYLVRFTRINDGNTKAGETLKLFTPNIFKPNHEFFIDDNPKPYKYDIWTSIPGNYHPLLHKISTKGLGIQVKQAMAASCITHNSVEFIVHRSFLQNDLRGLWGTLKDYTRVSVSHYLDLTPKNGNTKGVYMNKAEQPVHVLGYVNETPNKSEHYNNAFSLRQGDISNYFQGNGNDVEQSFTETGKKQSNRGHINIIGISHRAVPFPTVSSENWNDVNMGNKNLTHLYIRFSAFPHAGKRTNAENTVDLNLSWVLQPGVKILKIFRVGGDLGLVDDKNVKIFGNGDNHAKSTGTDGGSKTIRTEVLVDKITIRDGTLELYHVVIG